MIATCRHDRVLLRLFQPVDLSRLPQHPAPGGRVRRADRAGGRSWWAAFSTPSIPASMPSRENPVPAKAPICARTCRIGRALAGLTIMFPPQRLSGEQRQGHARLHPARSRRAARPFARAVFEAYWGDDQDISQDEVLSAVCAVAGVDPRASLAGHRRAGGQGQAQGQHRRAHPPRRLRLADHFRRRNRHVFGNDRLALVRAAVERSRKRPAAE